MKKLLFIIPLVIFTSIIYSQTLFQNVYSVQTGNWFYLNSFNAAKDGSFYAVSDDNNNNRPVVIKFDSLGDIIWSKSYTNPNETVYAAKILCTKDGGFALAGQCQVIGGSQTNFCVVRCNSQGNILWANRYDLTYTESFYTMIETTDNGFLLSGCGIYGDYDHLARIDSLGNVVFFKHIFESTWQHNFIGSMEMASDSNYFLLLHHSSQNPETRILKIDINGNRLWSLAIGDTTASSVEVGGASVLSTPDGGCVIVGDLHGGPWFVSTLAICKITSQGTLDWIRMKPVYSVQFHQGYAVTRTSDFGYAIAHGLNNTGSTNLTDIHLTKTDSLGHFLWTKKYPGVCLQRMGIKETYDKGFMIAASAYLNSNPAILVIKTDSAGNTACNDSVVVMYDSTAILPSSTPVYYDSLVNVVSGPILLTEDSGAAMRDYCQLITSYYEFKAPDLMTIYPNPFHSQATVTINNSDSKSYSLKMLNLLGTTVFFKKSITHQSVTIDRGNLASGLYVCMLIDSKGLVSGTKKVLIE